MRTTDGSYKAHTKMLVATFFGETNDAKIIEFQQAVPPYIEDEIYTYLLKTHKTNGVANPNMPWCDTCSCRHGYRNNIPGLFAEALLVTGFVLFNKVAWTDIKPYYDKHSQVELKLDVNICGIDYQCKTVQWDGSRLVLDPEWFKGTARRVALVDIDDKTIHIVDSSQIIRDFNGGNVKVYRNELEQITINKFDFTGLYKRGDNI